MSACLRLIFVAIKYIQQEYCYKVINKAERTLNMGLSFSSAWNTIYTTHIPFEQDKYEKHIDAKWFLWIYLSRSTNRQLESYIYTKTTINIALCTSFIQQNPDLAIVMHFNASWHLLNWSEQLVITAIKMKDTRFSAFRTGSKRIVEGKKHQRTK